jgi:hypothetical protein
MPTLRECREAIQPTRAPSAPYHCRPRDSHRCRVCARHFSREAGFSQSTRHPRFRADEPCELPR